jgi:hypothetical protein
MSTQRGNILLEVLLFLALSLLFLSIQATLFHDLAKQEKEISQKDQALDLQLSNSFDYYPKEQPK